MRIGYVSAPMLCVLFFFFNDTATTEIYPLSLHDALPISSAGAGRSFCSSPARRSTLRSPRSIRASSVRTRRREMPSAAAVCSCDSSSSNRSLAQPLQLGRQPRDIRGGLAALLAPLGGLDLGVDVGVARHVVFERIERDGVAGRAHAVDQEVLRDPPQVDRE